MLLKADYSNERQGFDVFESPNKNLKNKALKGKDKTFKGQNKTLTSKVEENTRLLHDKSEDRPKINFY